MRIEGRVRGGVAVLGTAIVALVALRRRGARRRASEGGFSGAHEREPLSNTGPSRVSEKNLDADMRPRDTRGMRPVQFAAAAAWVLLLGVAVATIVLGARLTAQATATPNARPTYEAYLYSPIYVLVRRAHDTVNLVLRVEPSEHRELVQGYAVDSSGHPDPSASLVLLVPVWDGAPLRDCNASLTEQTIRSVRPTEGELVSSIPPPSIEVTPEGAPASESSATGCIPQPLAPPLNPGYTYYIAHLAPIYSETSLYGEPLPPARITEYNASLVFEPNPVVRGSHGYTVILPKLVFSSASIPKTYREAALASRVTPLGAHGSITEEVDGSFGDRLVGSNPPAALQTHAFGLGDVAEVNIGAKSSGQDLGATFSPARMDYSSDSLSERAARQSLEGGIAIGVGASLAASTLFFLLTVLTDTAKRQRAVANQGARRTLLR
jgi:hypothetical protein